MIDLRQTAKYAEYMKAIGWKVERIGSAFVYIKKIPLLGNLIKIQRPQHLKSETIKKLIKIYKPYQIVIEPKYRPHHTILATHNFRQIKNTFLPSKTINIDLTKSESRLLNEMHPKTRYNIKKITQNKTLTTYFSNDIESFANFWQKCAKERGMFLSQKKEITELFRAFGQNAQIIFVTLRANDPLAAVLLVCTKDISYYMYAASTKEGKGLFAPTLAAWEAIKLAGKKGCKVFDFEGIYDERYPLKSWKGFTRFKKSFGGKEVLYPGTFVKYRLPI